MLMQPRSQIFHRIKVAAIGGAIGLALMTIGIALPKLPDRWFSEGSAEYMNTLVRGVTIVVGWGLLGFFLCCI
jgi:hypothetical protein